MDIFGPRKVVEVPGGTGNHETCGIHDGTGFGHGDVLVALFVVTSKSAAVEEEAVVVCESIAAWADEVAWEDEGWYAADAAIGFHRRPEEVLDAEHRPQSWLVDALVIPDVPVVEAGGDCGGGALIYDSTWPEGRDELTRP
jgi:hypothetical protein